MDNKDKGFTLIELLLTIALIAILAGAVFVGVGNQREKARLSKALAEMSGTIQPMMMCRSDNPGTGNVVTVPNKGSNICSLGSGYGSWPSLDANFSYSAPPVGTMNSSSWYFSASGYGKTICCTSGSVRCGELLSGSCNATANIE